MTRKTQRNQIKKQIKKSMSHPWQPFEQIDLTRTGPNPPGMTRAFRNNRYTVMVYDNAMTTHGKAIKAILSRHDKKPDHEFLRVQMIKREIFGAETLAIQYFPIASPVPSIRDASCVLWVFPDGNLPLPLDSQWVLEDIEQSTTVDLMQQQFNQFTENINKARNNLADKMQADGLSPAEYGIKENITLSDKGPFVQVMKYECSSRKINQEQEDPC
jgi:hypothetical protein